MLTLIGLPPGAASGGRASLEYAGKERYTLNLVSQRVETSITSAFTGQSGAYATDSASFHQALYAYNCS